MFKIGNLALMVEYRGHLLEIPRHLMCIIISTTTTEFRAIVSSGSCGNDTSNAVTITVDPPVVGGTLSGSTTVCEGSNSGSLVLSGEVGNVIGWETSTDDGITWTNITNTTNTQNYSNISITTWYRAEVQSGTCGNAYSDIAVVTVDAAVFAGTLSGAATVCASSNSGTITLAGTLGNVQDWGVKYRWRDNMDFFGQYFSNIWLQ